MAEVEIALQRWSPYGNVPLREILHVRVLRESDVHQRVIAQLATTHSLQLLRGLAAEDDRVLPCIAGRAVPFPVIHNPSKRGPATLLAAGWSRCLRSISTPLSPGQAIRPSMGAPLTLQTPLALPAMLPTRPLDEAREVRLLLRRCERTSTTGSSDVSHGICLTGAG